MRDEKTEEICELKRFLDHSLYTFINSFVIYLNQNSINKQMNRFFSGLDLELFIWSDKSDNQVENSLNDQLSLKRVKIGKNNMVEIKEGEEQDPDKIKEYIINSECTAYAVSPVAKVRYNAAKKFVGGVCVMWGIRLDVGKRKVEEFMAEVLLDFLYKCFDNYDLDFLQAKELTVWEEKEKRFSFNLINAYVKKVFSVLPVPPEDVIKKIAYRHYEKSEVRATIYFAEKETCQTVKKEKKKGIVWMKKQQDQEKSNVKEYVSWVRKMLETCKNGNVLLVQAEKKETDDEKKTNSQYPIVAVMSEKIAKDYPSWYRLEFIGRGEWRLLVNDEVILEYLEGVYTVNRQHFETELEKKVDEITLIQKENKSKFINIFEYLNRCPHGALMILGREDQIQKEVERLSAFAKGTMIAKLELSGKENLNLLQGLATIDGAIMVDYEGACYGFGIILDGRTKMKGDVGRGSRYNSALNYAANHKGHAVVFSEDKENGIQVIDGINEARKLVKSRYCHDKKREYKKDSERV